MRKKGQGDNLPTFIQLNTRSGSSVPWGYRRQSPVLPGSKQGLGEGSRRSCGMKSGERGKKVHIRFRLGSHGGPRMMITD